MWQGEYESDSSIKVAENIRIYITYNCPLRISKLNSAMVLKSKYILIECSFTDMTQKKISKLKT